MRAFDPTVTEDGCYQVNIESDTVSWTKVGTEAECTDLVNIQVWMTQNPLPSLAPVRSQCTAIKIYDTSWQLLSTEDLQAASAGATLRLAVSSNTTSGDIDEAKFIINGIESATVSSKKADTGELYYDYLLPVGTTNFDIEVKLNHSQFGWF